MYLCMRVFGVCVQVQLTARISNGSVRAVSQSLSPTLWRLFTLLTLRREVSKTRCPAPLSTVRMHKRPSLSEYTGPNA